MPQIVNYTNILDPLSREVKLTTARNILEVLADLQYDAIAYDVKIYLNNNLQLEDFEVNENDIIVVQIVPKGGGGDILRTVAMIALVVAGTVLVQPELVAYAGTIGFTGAGATAFAAIGTAAFVYGGALAINAILPMDSTSNLLGNNNLSTSSTYSWDNAYNKYQQGTPIPKVFGTHKVTPPLIAKYIESIDDKQYFHGLYALNDGELEYNTIKILGRTIKTPKVENIKINDEPIENFDNVTIDLRAGTNNQLVIPDFATTRFDKAVSQKLSTDWDTTTSEDGVSELTAVIYFPRGLYYMNDSAQVVDHSVKLVIEYSADGINWTPITSNTTVTSYGGSYTLSTNAFDNNH